MKRNDPENPTIPSAVRTPRDLLSVFRKVERVRLFFLKRMSETEQLIPMVQG